jgi:dihydrofolate reductase
MKIEAILAHDLNNGIGNDGKLPWKCKKDMDFFKQTTTGHFVLMGSKTFESLGKPLPNRVNIVLTRDPKKYIDKYKHFKNVIFTSRIHFYEYIRDNLEEFKKVFDFLEKECKIFIIGGNEIFNMYLPVCDSIWITTIKNIYECDTFFTYNVSIYKKLITYDDDELCIANYWI